MKWRGCSHVCEVATGELISPQDMARFLEELLVQEEQLTLLRLQTLDVKPLLARRGKNRFFGGLRCTGMVLRSSFPAAIWPRCAIWSRWRVCPGGFFWDSVSYEVLDYPESVVRLELHTLESLGGLDRCLKCGSSVGP